MLGAILERPVPPVGIPRHPHSPDPVLSSCPSPPASQLTPHGWLGLTELSSSTKHLPWLASGIRAPSPSLGSGLRRGGTQGTRQPR